MILGEDAEKAFVKLRDRYVRAKRELKKKLRSGASSASVDKWKEWLRILKFLAWFDNYAKPRSTRSNVVDVSDEYNEETTDVENNVNFTQSGGESDKDLSPQSVAVTWTKIKSSALKKNQKAEHKQDKRVRGGKTYQGNIEDEELEILRSRSQEVELILLFLKSASHRNFATLGELSLMMKWILLNSKLLVS